MHVCVMEWKRGVDQLETMSLDEGHFKANRLALGGSSCEPPGALFLFLCTQMVHQVQNGGSIYQVTSKHFYYKMLSRRVVF